MPEAKEYPKMKDIYGSLVFDRREMKQRLPKDVYEMLAAAIEGRQKLDSSVADTVALAMKDWAVSKGADHWAHWFHPLSETTAEKHAAFLTADENGNPLNSFRGKDLMQSEPDASSFPSGGTRSTFEARGYSAWDPTSPAFIIRSKKGGTLCIPSVFLAYDGSPLDLKTYLLRAMQAAESRAMKMLKLFGNRGVRYVHATVGAEQEFFLLDRPRAQKRPDIRFCGRTLVGSPPPRDQKMEDHYFGAIPARVLSYMEDVQRDLARLGVDIATRHNEAARCQFEFAPKFTEANLSCDQNQLIMETMRKMAREHELRLLFHEKPFQEMNGSGKHINFSFEDSEGRNLLKPSTNHRRNVIFLSFLSSFILGVSRHFGLLQASVSTPGNMYRLGGHEAPPFIISVYLGETVAGMIRAIEEGYGDDSVRPAKGTLDLGLPKLPDIVAFDSDRNRTSPIAFTGNKFEFRAPGASQAMATPVMALLSVWAAGLDEFIKLFEKRIDDGEDAVEAAIQTIREVSEMSRNIRFEGDAYTEKWHKEAEGRGLVKARTIPQGIDLFMEPSTVKMLEEMGVFTKKELEAFHTIKLENFVKNIEIEMSVLRDMVWEGILPAISKQLILERDSCAAAEELGTEGTDGWKQILSHLAASKIKLIKQTQELAKLRERMAAMTTREHADAIVDSAVPLMAEIRRSADSVEVYLSNEIMPYPNYRNLLSLSA
ncbi:glutamine synthetase III [Synergistes jonesii]|uniref:Glutamine synthetase n=1 Tax=Synergistes jonesii TaxID=2754 RepID=A0A073IPB5_9BACT|nr:glutamine synthetase III [Synergistes jonesii]KEJ91549.1 glutamine synthetase [Synergistes jonesii]OFB60604.1 glutamine synthetase [Synergistes jonesii]OFB61587.1 glutamine synthetase [Synergistes jonesii]OFB64998.1 glutamine synthetase [Synergistes jonesii]OFB66801.1 glutamine synthetase [Synergistes jonesii]